MKLNKKNTISIFITLIFIVLICYNIDLSKLIITLKHFNLKSIFLIIPLYLLSLILRGIRWNNLLSPGQNYSNLDMSLIYTAGSALNVYLPARAGDFFRAYYAAKKFDLKKLKVFGSIVLERIFDGISVILVLITGIFLYKETPFIRFLTVWATIIFTGSLILFFYLLKTNKIESICNFLKEKAVLLKNTNICDLIETIKNQLKFFIQGFESLTSFKISSKVFILSILIWTLECIVTYLIIINFGYTKPFSISLFVISFISLSTIIPSSSIMIGPYQYAYILALEMFYIDKSSALGIAFTQQMITIIILSAVSLFFIIKNNVSCSKIRELADKNINDINN